jgi:hypothetical protein
MPMPELVFSQHARNQMSERGATESEVISAIERGEAETARHGRSIYRKNFVFEREWRGRHFRVKQVAPVVAGDGDRLTVVTVYVFYF